MTRILLRHLQVLMRMCNSPLTLQNLARAGRPFNRREKRTRFLLWQSEVDDS